MKNNLLALAMLKNPLVKNIYVPCCGNFDKFLQAKITETITRKYFLEIFSIFLVYYLDKNIVDMTFRDDEDIEGTTFYFCYIISNTEINIDFKDNRIYIIETTKYVPWSKSAIIFDCSLKDYKKALRFLSSR